MTKNSDGTPGVPAKVPLKIIMNNIGDFIREVENGLLDKVDLKIEDLQKIMSVLEKNQTLVEEQYELISPFKHNYGEKRCLEQKI